MPPSRSTPRARALILEAGVRLLGAATRRGAVLFGDALQWADASSLKLLA